jgi:hypothetical protein
LVAQGKTRKMLKVVDKIFEWWWASGVHMNDNDSTEALDLQFDSLFVF